MKIFFRIFLIALCFEVLLIADVQAVFYSDIFKYEDPQAAKKLHVLLKGENWDAQDIQGTDIPDYQKLFGNEKVVQKYGDRKVRSFEVTKKSTENWLLRFQNGNPHGALTIRDLQKKDQFIGHIIAGAGDRKGTSEIAYAIEPDYWRQRITSGVVGAIVKEWGPEVRRIGLGKGLDELQDLNVIKAFQCFKEEPLNCFEATASPSNPGSWKILDKNDFVAAQVNVENTEPIKINLDEVHTFQRLEDNLLEFFSPSSTSSLLQNGVRYRFIDTVGPTKNTKEVLRTFSYHKQYNCIKYHFERQVGEVL